MFVVVVRVWGECGCGTCVRLLSVASVPSLMSATAMFWGSERDVCFVPRDAHISLSLVFFLLFCFICFGFSDAEVDRQRLKNITLQNRVFESDYLDLNFITTMIYNIYNSHISSYNIS